MNVAKITELSRGPIRHDYSHNEISEIYDLPVTKLIFLAQSIQQRLFPEDNVQLCTLLSVKTGGCREDCGYCPQSAHHQSEVDAHPLLDADTIEAAARRAKQNGSTRFCMGAAWRSPPAKQFDRLLEAVRRVDAMGLEVCVTAGMLTHDQAEALQQAGVHAYNHNLDTSPEYYPEVITTRTYQDRLDTLANVRAAGMTVCCGGIIGMGESKADRIGLLQQLNKLAPHPESVPINKLVKVSGTPLDQAAEIDTLEMVRTIATARILMPASRVRLSAGRTEMSEEMQTLCFLAGANSIFAGEKLLTTPNPERDVDIALLNKLGLPHQTHKAAP